METNFRIGQRWISTMEPELGLGIITDVDQDKVKIDFTTSKVTRYYAASNSPLKRVQFRIGDEIKTKDDQPVTIKAIKEIDHLFYYCSSKIELPESAVNDTISFLTPLQRLRSANIDQMCSFQLRTEMLEFNSQYLRSITKGFIGPRIRVLPHQLFIAQAAAVRQTQRFLLADEVGLGKTIEACLILHQLLLTGKIQRALIIVPDSLMYQWFIELYRKFNLSFTIFDEDFYNSTLRNHPDANPFATQQLGLTISGFIFSKPSYQSELLDAGWDLVIVDEVHRIPEASSEYLWLKQLADRTPSMLLLTATPEVMGYKSLFTICKLLYPEIYKNYEDFLKNAEKFGQLSNLIKKIESAKKLTTEETAWIEEKVHIDENILSTLKTGNKELYQTPLIEALLANYGLGHLLFRNTRARINIFPKRNLNLTPINPTLDATNAPMITWLVTLLQQLSEKKILLICHTKQKVIAIQQALLKIININIAVFHEDLSLIQRDRMAAYFADENGAQLLICSEIGSEGRNFQFAQHLVFFDYPLDLELIEQRIGRLDRIGQAGVIQIHTPYIIGSPEEVIVRWLNEGCQAFTSLYSYGNRLINLFGQRLTALTLNYDQNRSSTELTSLINETKLAAQHIATELEKSRDRLLERNSFAANTVQELTQQIEQQDAHPALSRFMHQIFDHFELNREEITPETWLIKASGDYSDILPGFRGEEMIVTFDRQTALIREDYLFLTWDHPMVRGAIDLFLGSEKGNCTFAHWIDNKEQNLYIEAFFMIECLAPTALPVDRYLHLFPVRILVDHNNLDCTKDYSTESINKKIKPGEPAALNQLLDHGADKIEMMLEQAQHFAAIKLKQVIEESTAKMENEYDQTIAQETYLQKVNPHLSQKEIEKTKIQKEQLKRHLTQARLRLDTIRLIQRSI